MPFTEEQIKIVQELRQLTGEGVMECKKALINCDWDIEKAKVYLSQSESYKTRI